MPDGQTGELPDSTDRETLARAPPLTQFGEGGLREGHSVGPWVLGRRLGEGGFGAVWLAERQEPIVQRAAVKVIRPGMDSEAVAVRFAQERQALAAMEHPHVARLLDAGVTASGRPYFAMEFVEGDPITAFCDRRSLPVRDRLAMFLHVCEAIQHAHTKGVIHRDIKPSNVLVEEVDGRAVPKVIDFGVAKALAHSPLHPKQFTEIGQLVGTLEYMSPEQATMDTPSLDTRADVYSLGVLLYELLTGAVPFDSNALRSKGFDEIRHIIQDVDPPRPSARLSGAGSEAKARASARRTSVDSLARELQRELEWIPMKAMRKEREERYQSPSEIAADIARYLRGEPLQAGPPTRAYRTRKFLRRNRVLVGVAASVFIGVVLGVGGLTWGLIRTSQALAKDRYESYLAGIAAAAAAIAADDYVAAHRILGGCHASLRDWEWHYLMRQCDTSRVVLRGHEAPVMDAVLSEDGRIVVTASLDGTARVWDAATGAQRVIFSGHDSGVSAVAISAGGRVAASGSVDGVVKLWSVEDGAELGSADVGTAVRGLSARAQVAGFVRSRVWVDTDTGVRRLVLWGPPWCVAGVCSSDPSPELPGMILSGPRPFHRTLREGWLAEGPSASHSDDSVGVGVTDFLFDADDGPTVLVNCRQGRLERLSGPSGGSPSLMTVSEPPIVAAALSRDGRWIVAADAGKCVHFWAPPGQDARGAMKPLPAEVSAVAVEAQAIAAASIDGNIWYWGKQSVPVQRLRGHSGTVRRLAMSPDGEVLLSASDDGTARVWRPRDVPDPARCLQGSGLAGAELRCALALPTGRELREAAVSDDGSRGAARLDDGTAATWSAPDGAALAQIRTVNRDAGWVQLSQDGRTLVLPLEGNKLAITDGDTGWVTSIVPGAATNCLPSITADGQLLYFLARPASGLACWDPSTNSSGALPAPWDSMSAQPVNGETGIDLRNIPRVDRFIRDMSGTAAGHGDGRHNLQALIRAVSQLETMMNPPSTAIMSRSGTAAAVFHQGAIDATLWTGEGSVARIASLPGTSGAVDAAFSADGLRLALVKQDRSVEIWATRGAKLLLTIQLASIPTAVELNRTGTRLAVITDAASGALLIWDTLTGRQLLGLHPRDDAFVHARFEPGQGSILAVTRHGKLVVLPGGPSTSG